MHTDSTWFFAHKSESPEAQCVREVLAEAGLAIEEFGLRLRAVPSVVKRERVVGRPDSAIVLLDGQDFSGGQPLIQGLVPILGESRLLVLVAGAMTSPCAQKLCDVAEKGGRASLVPFHTVGELRRALQVRFGPVEDLGGFSIVLDTPDEVGLLDDVATETADAGLNILELGVRTGYGIASFAMLVVPEDDTDPDDAAAAVAKLRTKFPKPKGGRFPVPSKEEIEAELEPYHRLDVVAVHEKGRAGLLKQLTAIPVPHGATIRTAEVQTAIGSDRNTVTLVVALRDPAEGVMDGMKNEYRKLADATPGLWIRAEWRHPNQNDAA